jgi:hypothetical protein
MARYFTRLSAALSKGEQINNVLLIEPTTTAWMYQGDPEHRDHLEKLGNEFQQLVTNLAKSQVEFDIGSEYIIANHGAVEGKQLRVGRRTYHTVIVPPLTENLNRRTMSLLGGYLNAGGMVISCAKEAPSFVDGQVSPRGRTASLSATWNSAAPAQLPRLLLLQALQARAAYYCTIGVN